MRYYLRSRGQDEVSGPYSVEELESALKLGTVTPLHLVLEEQGLTMAQAANHWDYQWAAISKLPGLEAHAPAVLKEPTHALTHEERKAAARQDLLVGGSICCLGILVTVISYLAASQSYGRGAYVFAWGAIAFGGIRFAKGVLAKNL